MYFAKNEVIELNDKKKYLVLDTYIDNDEIYYKVIEINPETNEKVGSEVYFTTVNQEGKIYINYNVSLDKIKELEQNKD